MKYSQFRNISFCFVGEGAIQIISDTIGHFSLKNSRFRASELGTVKLIRNEVAVFLKPNLAAKHDFLPIKALKTILSLVIVKY